ncbi:hypothetical protein GCM10027579_26290 [Calidifontibacter terrae]
MTTLLPPDLVELDELLLDPAEELPEGPVAADEIPLVAPPDEPLAEPALAGDVALPVDVVGSDPG